MTSLLVSRPAPVLRSSQSSFAGVTSTLQRLSLAQTSGSRSLCATVEASKVCQLTGKKANNGYVVTFSHTRNKKLQEVNLQYKKIYWPEGKRWVKLRICTRAIKTIEKNGLQTMAKEAGINLWKLPFEDVSKARLDYLAANPQQPHIPKSIASRRMKNPEKLAASQKKPLVARYVIGGKIEYTRASLE